MKRILIVVAQVVLVCILLSGCGGAPPLKEQEVTKSNLPSEHLIEGIPIYRQGYMDCGPTSLRMVLNFYGKNLSQEEAVKARRGRGTSVSDLEAYARFHGFEVCSFYDSTKKEMKYQLAQGYPLITVGIPPPRWYKSGRYSGEGHYVVVGGYDDSRKVFIIYDPAIGRRLEISYGIFNDYHRSHQTHNNYVICVYPKKK